MVTTSSMNCVWEVWLKLSDGMGNEWPIKQTAKGAIARSSAVPVNPPRFESVGKSVPWWTRLGGLGDMCTEHTKRKRDETYSNKCNCYLDLQG